MYMRHGEIRETTIERDCEAVMVPWGTSTTLPAGSAATVTQQLGGSVTVMVGGNLYRVAGKDADALGLEPEDTLAGAGAEGEPADAGEPPTAASVEAAAWRVLGSCFDPEIPIDIVNLGLVYRCEALPLDDGGFRLEVAMTLTAPGCGMGTLIADEARDKLLRIRGVEQVDVDLVWDPPWSREMMSDAARLEMGLF
jgi:probable FeS assembly SUF system protein SufT